MSEPSVSPSVTGVSTGSPPAGSTTHTLPACTDPWTAVIGRVSTSVAVPAWTATVAAMPGNTGVPAGTAQRAVVPVVPVPPLRGSGAAPEPPPVPDPVLTGAPRVSPEHTKGAGTALHGDVRAGRRGQQPELVGLGQRCGDRQRAGAMLPTASPTATTWSTSTSSAPTVPAAGAGTVTVLTSGGAFW